MGRWRSPHLRWIQAILRRRPARRLAGWSASDNAWPPLTWRVRRPSASASTPITSAPAPAGSVACSSTNTRPVAYSATAPVMVLHPASAGCGRWATTRGQVPGVEAGAGDERGAERVRQGAPDGEGRPQRDDLAEAPPRIARQVEKCGCERRV